MIVGGQSKYQDGERITPVEQKRAANDVTREAGSTIDLHADGGD